MNGRHGPFPLRFGRGSQRVSLYAPTPALPYYRLMYRVGGKRLQRTFACIERAEDAAKAIAEQIAKAQVLSKEMLKKIHKLLKQNNQHPNVLYARQSSDRPRYLHTIQIHLLRFSLGKYMIYDQHVS